MKHVDITIYRNVQFLVSGEYQGVVYSREVVYTALLSDLPPKCHYKKGKMIPLQARCGPEGG